MRENMEGMTSAGVHPDVMREIETAIRGNASPKILRGILEDYHENDIAEVLEKLSDKERKKVIRVLDAEMLGNIFEYLDEETAGAFLTETDIRKAALILSQMETDAAVDVLREIGRERRQLIIEMMDRESRQNVALIASFDEDEIGSRMTTNFISIRENVTIRDAMRELVNQAKTNDNIYTIYVVDETGAFYGAIDLKDLITADREDDLESLIVTSFPYVYGNETIDDCMQKLKDYSENSIPVLNESNEILGIITSQNIVDVVDEEMGEDYVKLAGLIAEEDLKEPLKESMKKRLPWLMVLLFLGMAVSSVVGVFEKVVSTLPLIMAFQSLILDMAGNVGTQSLAVTIRVLTDENLTFGKKMGLVFKEMRVGLANGVLLGTCSVVLVGIYIFLAKGKPWNFALSVSVCIGVAMAISMLISSAMGTLIPLFFKKIKVDPAVASGPLITTVNDLVAVVAYYGLSWIMLLRVMHLA